VKEDLGRDNEMDDIEAVFEQRFDETGSWTRPPRPVDAEVYDAEVRQGIDGCLDQVPTNQRMAFVLREIEGMGTRKSVRFWRSRALT
jgi:DNA-directed RNA polymerase specialized sigma24 family protein